MKKNIITTYAMLIYVIVFVIASAGAINYGFSAKEHIYTVAGIINLIFGGWTAYKVWRADNPKVKKEE